MEPWLCLVGTENFTREVILECKPVLLVCLIKDDHYTELMRAIQTVAKRFENRLKVAVLLEDSLGLFKKRLKIKGTPTFLLMLEGKEIGRILGVCNEEVLANWIAAKMEAIQSGGRK
jgi:thioredoxin-like negative regulator of GroEL